MVGTLAYRIGVDVGGTFTDAVAIDISTMELAGVVKVPTTHHHPRGVSEGIRLALTRLMQECSISPEEVLFIAHGTTQATNALLEGDVDRVAVISAGSEQGTFRVKSETAFDHLDLGAGKQIPVKSCFLKEVSPEKLDALFDRLHGEHIKSLVAASAYSVDHPETEDAICRQAAASGFYCTATHEMSALYGLRTRTKTAVINGSILPKMVETTEYMLRSVQEAGITRPLMIMRSDGGVMSAGEVCKRPVQTILSGPAAGVAGALLYGKVTEGLFLEVGGTSTDISLIRGGRVMVQWAQIGDHKTYVNSLDIRTVAVAGGSMLRLENGRLTCGPRSAHIARLQYCCFAPPLPEGPLEVVPYRVQGDVSEYFALRDPAGGMFALTLTCLANYAGYVDADDFSKGSSQNVRRALDALSQYLQRPVEELLEEVFSSVSACLQRAMTDLAETYRLKLQDLELFGGGGGCSAVLPVLAERTGLPYRKCPNAHVISPIGVAMAMVRETCERTITDPTQTDLIRLQEEVTARAIQAGAVRERLEVVIEQEPLKNLVRATATGVADAKLQTVSDDTAERNSLLEALLKKRDLSGQQLLWDGGNRHFWLFQFQPKPRSWWRSLLGKRTQPLFVLGADGSIKLYLPDAGVRQAAVRTLEQELNAFIDAFSSWGDAGEQIPEIFLIAADRLYDYSMIRERKRAVQSACFEMQKYSPDEVIFLVCGI